MKHFILALSLLLISVKANSQELIISRDGSLLKYNSKQKKVYKNTIKLVQNFEQTETFYIDEPIYSVNDIEVNLNIATGFNFSQGIKNPYNPNQFVYMERQEIGEAFNLYVFDKKANSKQLLMSKVNKNNTEMAFKPIGWTKNENEVILESFFIHSSKNHTGVWIYNLNTNKLSKLALHFEYFQTPVLSPDRSKLYFVGTLDAKLDRVHGNQDVVFEYQIVTLKTKKVIESKGKSMIINGFDAALKNEIKNENAARNSTLQFYLPWELGKTTCVSRHGTPEPTGAHTNVGFCGFPGSAGGQHTYLGVDFATSQTSDENVTASAAGVVTFAGIDDSLTSGFGRLVVIKHSDGNESFYGHNKSISVVLGQTVTKGQTIAKEGTTGGSTGDHIHFEWRTPANVRFRVPFVGIGVPRQDFIYLSNNSTTTVNTPTAIAPAQGAINVALPVVFTYSNPVVATSFRIQVSKTNTGWTAANGFTSVSTPTANVVYNAGVNTLTSSTWTEGSTGSFEGPKPSTTYFYTIRSFSLVSGTSSYTAVKSFTTAFGVQLLTPAIGATVNSSVAFSWSSPATSSSSRIQVSKTNTNWTAADGFTATANANVVVNHGTPNLFNYSWTAGSVGSLAAPIAGTTYYWTVRIFSPATGTSQYSPVRSFTVGTIAAKSNVPTTNIISESLEKSVVVYPNPSDGMINLSIESISNEAQILIFNLNGVQVFDKKYATVKGQNLISEDVSNLQNGTYLMKIIDGEKTTNQTIIMQNK